MMSTIPKTRPFKIGSRDRALCAGILIALSLALTVPAESKIQPARIIPADGEFPSSPPYQFADTLAQQEAQLALNPLMRRFAESRKSLANSIDSRLIGRFG